MMERAMIKHQSSKGPNTSFVAVNCPFPVQFDVYWGCSHKCKYCFANKRGGFNSGESRVESDDGIMRYGTARQLADWIKGKRSKSEAWCDWNIPIKFGTNSDPFQPCELKERATLKCLKVLAKTGYPFILISKGATIAARPEYLAGRRARRHTRSGFPRCINSRRSASAPSRVGSPTSTSSTRTR